MASLVLPDKVTLELKDTRNQPLCVPGVLFCIHMYATHKNDFLLQPFVSNESGVVSILKWEMLAEAEAHYDSGLMDYDRLEGCSATVSIAALSEEEIRRTIQSRKTVWTTLLKGETKRWQTIEELLATYEMASNQRIRAKPINATWSLPGSDYSYIVECDRL